MFDIGFWEICLVGLVSLIVIGPERLPKAASVAGFWIGKTRNIVASVKSEIKEELQAEEIRQTLREQANLEGLQKTLEEGSDAVNDAKALIKSLPEEHTKQAYDSK